MDLEERLELACRPPVQEVVLKEELKERFETHREPVHYIGLEISGELHIGSLLLTGNKINDLKKAGCKTQVFLADWHSVINNKFGGQWEKVQEAAKYYEEAFTFYCPGTRVIKGSDVYHHNDEYWRDVIHFSKHMTLKRATRCLTIMGRSESDSLELAQFFYPSMQAVDMKYLEVDIAHAGMDQRKIHMAAREIFPKMKWKKPVALHHRILPSMAPPTETGEYENKMSKSKPGSAIFIHDSEKEIREKMNKAYCPEETRDNPVLAILKHLVFNDANELTVNRPKKFGGDLTYHSYEEVEKAYTEKRLHAQDLKNATAEALNERIAPVRTHFEKKKELLKVFDGA
ncbi:tyrosine--tRNA ligase [Candidatus Micrarchaeota archaeon]|nr:tyrosine--tRNA ligase [Candidatus Micrarchaeota archaeon]